MAARYAPFLTLVAACTMNATALKFADGSRGWNIECAVPSEGACAAEARRLCGGDYTPLSPESRSLAVKCQAKDFVPAVATSALLTPATTPEVPPNGDAPLSMSAREALSRLSSTRGRAQNPSSARAVASGPSTISPPLANAAPGTDAVPAATKPNESTPAPKLAKYSAFAFFAEGGTFEVYSPIGKLLNREPDETSFRDGALRFTVVGPNRGIMSASLGAADVEVQRTDQSLSFIERGRGGRYLHVLTIEDRWRPNAKAFAASYSRNIEKADGERLVSIFAGYARPLSDASAR
jgi:hypothetical protein